MIRMRRFSEGKKAARHSSRFAVYLASTVTHLRARYPSCVMLFWAIWRSRISRDLSLTDKGAGKSHCFPFGVPVSQSRKSTWPRIVFIVKIAEILHPLQ